MQEIMKYLLLIVIVGVTQGFEDKTVAQYIADNPAEYSTLAGLLNTAGLVTALSGTGPFTVFAPTNAAFAKIQSTVDGLQQTPTVLAGILKYHVVNEFVLIPIITGPQSKNTLEGQALILDRSASGLTINNSTNTLSPADIVLNNGVIQPIDSVLLPPVMPTTPKPTTTTAPPALNIAQIILQDDTRFKDLFLALLLADIVSVLESGDYTVFAPVDSAFLQYQSNLLDPSAPGAQTIYQEVLKYHLVPGARTASQLSDGQTLYTLHGTQVTIHVGAGGVTVNGANVIDADIKATNGVIHAIDKLLVPTDIGLTQG